MPRACTICAHAQRSEIEAAIVSGASYRVVSRQFEVSHDAVQRHTSEHVTQAIKQAVNSAKAAKEEASGLDVVAQLKAINSVSLKILKAASDDPERYELALKAVDRVHKQLELQARLLGDISDQPTVNVWLPAPWSEIESAIVLALAPWPGAKVAVADALVRLEAKQSGRLN